MTSPNLARLRELHQLHLDGAARPADTAELVALLGPVLEVLGTIVTADAWALAAAAEEAADWEERLDGLDRGDCYRFGFHDALERLAPR